jgi:hypothetical protein
LQTISLLAHLAGSRGVWGPHLIVVPTSVILNWKTEFSMCVFLVSKACAVGRGGLGRNFCIGVLFLSLRVGVPTFVSKRNGHELVCENQRKRSRFHPIQKFKKNKEDGEPTDFPQSYKWAVSELSTNILSS